MSRRDADVWKAACTEELLAFAEAKRARWPRIHPGRRCPLFRDLRTSLQVCFYLRPLALAAFFDLEVHQMDVKPVFLNVFTKYEDGILLVLARHALVRQQPTCAGRSEGDAWISLRDDRPRTCALDPRRGDSARPFSTDAYHLTGAVSREDTPTHGMSDCRPVSTPMEPNFNLEKLSKPEIDRKPYPSALRALMCAMLGSRVD